MSANSQKNIMKKVISFQIHLPNQKNIVIYKQTKKKTILDLDKFFYYQHFSYNQFHKFGILNVSNKI